MWEVVELERGLLLRFLVLFSCLLACLRQFGWKFANPIPTIPCCAYFTPSDKHSTFSTTFPIYLREQTADPADDDDAEVTWTHVNNKAPIWMR
jgi:hypothetical protein